jgi:hypothetical protein
MHDLKKLPLNALTLNGQHIRTVSGMEVGLPGKICICKEDLQCVVYVENGVNIDVDC